MKYILLHPQAMSSGGMSEQIPVRRGHEAEGEASEARLIRIGHSWARGVVRGVKRWVLQGSAGNMWSPPE